MDFNCFAKILGANDPELWLNKEVGLSSGDKENETPLDVKDLSNKGFS